MKVIVTTGPAYEPIDEVRRITNFSTGELGILLSNELARAGFEVFCLKGEAATCPVPLTGCVHLPFTTNDDLHEQLARLSRAHEISAVFQVAALCDYKVKHVEDERGARQDAAKIESRAGTLILVLEPARKVIAEIRTLFPKALLIGWKYELNGARPDALAKVQRQFHEAGTDACVLNGRAWGDGFAVCTSADDVRELRDKPELVQFLREWLKERVSSKLADRSSGQLAPRR